MIFAGMVVFSFECINFVIPMWAAWLDAKVLFTHDSVRLSLSARLCTE